jgi:hypothetical protein
MIGHKTDAPNDCLAVRGECSNSGWWREAPDGGRRYELAHERGPTAANRYLGGCDMYVMCTLKGLMRRGDEEGAEGRISFIKRRVEIAGIRRAAGEECVRAAWGDEATYLSLDSDTRLE